MSAGSGYCPPKTEPEKTIEKSNLSEQKAEPVITELDNKIECPRCAGIMVLSSSFDKLVYSCESCSFILKCVQSPNLDCQVRQH